jgi:hypothetical protein
MVKKIVNLFFKKCQEYFGQKNLVKKSGQKFGQKIWSKKFGQIFG